MKPRCNIVASNSYSSQHFWSSNGSSSSSSPPPTQGCKTITSARVLQQQLPTFFGVALSERAPLSITLRQKEAREGQVGTNSAQDSMGLQNNLILGSSKGVDLGTQEQRVQEEAAPAQPTLHGVDGSQGLNSTLVIVVQPQASKVTKTRREEVIEEGLAPLLNNYFSPLMDCDPAVEDFNGRSSDQGDQGGQVSVTVMNEKQKVSSTGDQVHKDQLISTLHGVHGNNIHLQAFDSEAVTAHVSHAGTSEVGSLLVMAAAGEKEDYPSLDISNFMPSEGILNKAALLEDAENIYMPKLVQEERCSP
ncbi:hypothetical protein Taro_000900 [Colocasia esculenta]|uniref:Uncharacterized protein n=1 Tax=Colocasia esculenta TaxID=4460 RepID=A0A843TC57_COLES|nr:hypothetical protein [Colocasia esculenta]